MEEEDGFKTAVTAKEEGKKTKTQKKILRVGV
jgi:hypothetical protein